MCGIAGILRFDGGPVELADVRAMTDAISHRGPDDEGFYCGAGVGIGMRRLSIIDRAHGQQPIGNENGSIWVVFNGEIYNFEELRRTLRGRGHTLKTASDTETIVHLYEDHGPECVHHLRGMFAFALWDEPRRTLLLARDRVGIKPLYYARTPSALVFGSEVKAVLQAPGIEPELDWQAVSHLFSFSTTPRDRSIVAGVEKLEAGHLMSVDGGGEVRQRRYWQMRFEPDHARSESQWIDAVRGALEESVRLHRISEVPLGVFLSGGVDSSAVVAAMARNDAPQRAARAARPHGSGDTSISTFSVGFEETDYSELEYARLVADTFGTRHRETVLEPEVTDALEDIAWYLDEPFGDSSAIPTYMVSALAARDVTVVLSGDGGDEVFAGYERYVVERRERRNRFLPAPLRALLGSIGNALPEGATGREFLRHMALVGMERYLDAGALFKDDQKKKLFHAERWPEVGGYDAREPARRALATGDDHWLSALQRLDFENYLPLDILTKVDRMSMAHSIEARVPLLDHVLVELAAKMPPEMRLRGDRGKYIFKRALEGWLPQTILERPKRGFAIPLGRWFRGRLSDFVRDLLLSPRARARQIFAPAYVERLLALHEAGRPLDLQIWTLLSFELWCRAFLDRGARAARVNRPAPAVLVRSSGRLA